MDDIDSRVQSLEGRVAELQELISADTLFHEFNISVSSPLPGERPQDWIGAMTGSPGIVVHPSVARSSPCLSIDLGEGRRLVYNKGVVGPLDEEQQALYCADGVVTHQASDKQRQRLAAMGESASVCSVEVQGIDDAGKKLEAYISCIGREISAREGQ